MAISYQLDCDDFRDATCGGHNTNYNVKCIKFTSESECSEIEFDEGCTMTTAKTCQKKDASGSYQCYFFQNSDMTKCQKIEVDDKCEVITNRDCRPKSSTTLKENEICKFNSEGTRCSLQTKECSDYTASTCSQFGDNKCIKINVNYYDYETGSYGTSDKCQLVTVDGKCEVDNDGKCVDKSTGGPDANQKCSFNPLYTECKPIYKQCYEILDTTKCNTCQTSPANSKCLKIDNGYSTRCQNVEVNDSCEIKESGQCDVKTATDNNKCRFNTSYSGCEYYTVDDQNCVLSDTSGSLKCTDGTNLANKDKNKCDFVAKGTNKRCEPRAKACHLDYFTENTCNAENNCIYKYYSCYTVENDDYCEKKTNGECTIKEGKASSFSEYEKCDYVWKNDDYTYKCQKTYKECSEYTEQTKCNNAPEVDEKKCYYSESKCKTVYLYDNDYCTWNSQNGECEEKSSGKLSPYEKCYKYEPTGYDYDFISCGLRDKLCSDYSDSNCGNYSPEVKLCFNLEGNYCKDIKIDSQCSINGNNECTGNNCKFDEYKDRCYYQEESNGSLLKMSQFILLMLFFMF